MDEPKNAVVPAGSAGGVRIPPPPPPAEEADGDEGGMLRMSFLEHLEELRSRLIKAILGLGIAFVACLSFSMPLWDIVRQPAVAALTKIGVHPPNLVITEPMENFMILWFKLPLVISLFIASPWVLYQVWAFISPGLYRREKRLAMPFVACTAGLFISGGLFAYFIVFRYALTFLLGMGLPGGVTPMVTITSYFDLFVNVMLGVALVFELPVVIFFLTLLRIASPRWLLANSRYAILGIVILAAIVTPTPDAFNMTLFAVPMVLLYFIGVFASFLLVMRREGRRFPWAKIMMWTGIVLAGIAAFVYIQIAHYHMHMIRHWPFLMK